MTNERNINISIEIHLFVMISDWIDVYAIFANTFGVLTNVSRSENSKFPSQENEKREKFEGFLDKSNFKIANKV